MENSINIMESPRYADRDEEVCDGIVLCKGYAAVFMEFKDRNHRPGRCAF